MTDLPLTRTAFDAALAARCITPAARDRDAAFTIALFLDDCTRLLRDSPDAAAKGNDAD